MTTKPLQTIALTTAQRTRADALLHCYYDSSFLQVHIMPGFVNQPGGAVYGRYVGHVSTVAKPAVEAAERLIAMIAAGQ